MSAAHPAAAIAAPSAVAPRKILWHRIALWSVLRLGPSSEYADWFDVDWGAGNQPLLMAVLGQRIAKLAGVEPRALIAHQHHQIARSSVGDDVEIDEDQLGRIALVAMGDGVDDCLAHRHAGPVGRVFVESQLMAHVFGDVLHMVQYVDGALQFKMNAREATAHAYGRSIVSECLRSPLPR